MNRRRKKEGNSKARKSRDQTSQANGRAKRRNESKPNFGTLGALSKPELASHLGLQPSEASLRDFYKEVQRYENLQDFFTNHGSPKMAHKTKCATAYRALDYTRPYQVAVVGHTGGGKSELVCALLGRSGLVGVGSDDSVTGTALKFLHDPDITSRDDEKAVIRYRDAKDILELAKREFIEYFGLDLTLPKYSDKEDDKRVLIAAIAKQVSQASCSPSGNQDDFNRRQEGLLQITQEYLKYEEELSEESKSLSDDTAKQKLDALIQEASSDSRVAIIKEVTYHLHSGKDSSTVELPRGVCLVDLPGGGASIGRHAFVTSEVIRNSDASVFVTQDALLRANSGLSMDLARLVTQAIQPIPNIPRTKRILLVANKWDTVLLENKDQDNAIFDLARSLYGRRVNRKGKPYLTTSARCAIMARRLLQGEVHSSEEDPDYNSAVQSLYRVLEVGGDNPEPADVLEKSGVPNLAQAITRMVADHMKVRVSQAREAIDSVVDELVTEAELEQQQLGAVSAEDLATPLRISNCLSGQFRSVKELIGNFANTLNTADEDLRKTLADEAVTISTRIQSALAAQMPELWKENVDTDFGIISGNKEVLSASLQFFNAVQERVWDEGSRQLKPLAEIIATKFEEHLKEANLQENLVKLGYNQSEAEDKFSNEAINGLSEKMQSDVRAFSRLVALNHLANSEHRIVRAPSEEDPSDHTDVAFSEAGMRQLENVQLDSTQNFTGSDFDGILTSIESRYRKAITDSVADLINVYICKRFEFLAELLADAKNLFATYRAKSQNDSSFQEVILTAGMSEEDVQKANKVASLTKKLATLEQLR